MLRETGAGHERNGSPKDAPYAAVGIHRQPLGSTHSNGISVVQPQGILDISSNRPLGLCCTSSAERGESGSGGLSEILGPARGVEFGSDDIGELYEGWLLAHG